MPRDQRLLIGWFGIRGISSIYYLLYAIGQGLRTAASTDDVDRANGGGRVNRRTRNFSDAADETLQRASHGRRDRLIQSAQGYCSACSPQSCFRRASRPQLAR